MNVQVQAVRAEITELECSFSTETLLDRTAPLFDVLRRRVEFESSKADGRDAEYGWSKVEVTGNDAWRRSEIVALLRFRKDERHVVTLITPRVHIDRREEDAKRCVQYDAVLVKVYVSVAAVYV